MTKGPAASSDAAKTRMARQRRKDTAPEVALRRALHRRGLRFRVGVRVGRATPDVLFTRARIAVFVMGDFWHSCPTHATAPKSNSAWWADKLDANRERDHRHKATLEADGWAVVWVWECEDPTAAAERVAGLWSERIARG